MTYDSWKATNPDDQFLGPEPYIPELWEQLADSWEEAQRQEEIQKDIDQTSWGAEHELERLHDLSPSEVWKLMARVALKCMESE